MASIDMNTGITWSRLGTAGVGWWRQRASDATAQPIPMPCDPEAPAGTWLEGDSFPWQWPEDRHIKLLKLKTARYAILFPSFD